MPYFHRPGHFYLTIIAAASEDAQLHPFIMQYYSQTISRPLKPKVSIAANHGSAWPCLPISRIE